MISFTPHSPRCAGGFVDNISTIWITGDICFSRRWRRFRSFRAIINRGTIWQITSNSRGRRSRFIFGCGGITISNSTINSIINKWRRVSSFCCTRAVIDTSVILHSSIYIIGWPQFCSSCCPWIVLDHHTAIKIVRGWLFCSFRCAWTNFDTTRLCIRRRWRSFLPPSWCHQQPLPTTSTSTARGDEKLSYGLPETILGTAIISPPTELLPKVAHS